MSTISRRQFLGGCAALTSAGSTTAVALFSGVPRGTGENAARSPATATPADEEALYELLVIATEATRRAAARAEHEHADCETCCICEDASSVRFGAQTWLAVFTGNLPSDIEGHAMQAIATPARPTVVDRPYAVRRDDADEPELSAESCRQQRHMITSLNALYQALVHLEDRHGECGCDLCDERYAIICTVARFLDLAECSATPNTSKLVAATFRCGDPTSVEWHDARATRLPVAALRRIAVQVARECLA